MSRGAVVAVVGAGAQATEEDERVAFAVGRLVALRGAILVTGGLGGVMAAASRGAASQDGVVVGLLPGLSRDDANPWVGVALATGLGELRNGLVVRAADALIAIGGGLGTLSEVALALKGGKRVMGLGLRFDVPGVEVAAGPQEAVDAVLGPA